ncbi:hypothetical protein L484_002078 [Morus notabilis]|uniref:RsdA/BaiN/AoA(So)-like Rossmann fold-like domain-containing protein n=1 Tax=Morus notabilis TaxID=981085 RepID=W9QFS6_9ROSA|nr:hypothetical protein L484_002078 [Morus notabilis]
MCHLSDRQASDVISNRTMCIVYTDVMTTCSFAGNLTAEGSVHARHELHFDPLSPPLWGFVCHPRVWLPPLNSHDAQIFYHYRHSNSPKGQYLFLNSQCSIAPKTFMGILFYVFGFIGVSICVVIFSGWQRSEELLVVAGGGAAGVYGAIRAKTVAPQLSVLVIEKAKPLSKVKISGGGRCNVTNGHCTDNMVLAENYPRGHKEFRGSFFEMHGPVDTMSWFTDHGVELKVEEDGRVFPVSNSSSSIIDCLMSEAKGKGVVMQTKKVVKTASANDGKFLLGIEKNASSSLEYVEADYLLIASGSSSQGYSLASQLGHSVVDPVPSLFTFKTADSQLAELSGVTFPKVKAKLILENVKRNIQQFTQVGPMLVTHWGLSGPVILRLSAWGARDLFSSGYKGIVMVDFMPDLHIEDVKSILSRHKHQFAVCLKLVASFVNFYDFFFLL